MQPQRFGDLSSAKLLHCPAVAKPDAAYYLTTENFLCEEKGI